MQTKSKNFMDNLTIIWTIAFKDILDALKSRLVVAMVSLGCFILILPKSLPLIFEPPVPVVPVVGPGAVKLADVAKNDENLVIKPLNSAQEMPAVLCSAAFPEMGLEIPADYDISGRTSISVHGYICWRDRTHAAALQDKLAPRLAPVIGLPVEEISFQVEYVYPPATGNLTVSMTTLNAVLLVMLVGFFLVPHLFFEEKQNKTLDSLLVSPASIGQVVTGKALAGFFYILVICLLIFAIQWNEVVHWSLPPVFALTGGIFFVSVGLVLGGLFSNQQEAAGWITVLPLLFVGANFVELLHLELPSVLQKLLPWVPSVALGDLLSLALLPAAPATRILTDVAILIGFSFPLYAIVIWRVRRSDR